MSLLTRVRAAIAGAGMLLVHRICRNDRHLVERRAQSVHARWLRRLSHQGRVHRALAVLRRAARTDSAGRGWLLDVTNVSVTPYTYSEEFVGDSAVMSRDNLKIGFRVHTVWRVDGDQVPLFMERYSTTVDRESIHRDPDAVVKVAYANFVKEPMRTFSLDEVQRRNGLEVKDALIAIGDAVLARIRTYASGSPFIIDSVVVGNVQYPEEVANAVSRKLAATQELARKDTEIEIERKERTKREVQAQGIANAMEIIRGQLSGDVHPARSDRGAEGDGRIAESHSGLHPGRSDGCADHGDDGCDASGRSDAGRTTSRSQDGRHGLRCAPLLICYTVKTRTL